MPCRISRGKSRILHNAVDLNSFQPRAPLPRRPARALVLAKGPSFLNSVRDACAQRGLELSIVGPGIGNEVDDLPSYFRRHDLVFASARSALEAMATGCAVIVLDGRGFAGLVTHDVVSTWRQNNFGLRLLKRPVSTELILDAIDHYDAAEAQRVCNFIRANSSLDQYLDRLEAMYREVIAESAENPADRGDLLYRMGLSIQRIESAWGLEAHAAAAREVQSACNELNARFEQRLRAREAELRAEFARRWSNRGAPVRPRCGRNFARSWPSGKESWSSRGAPVSPKLRRGKRSCPGGRPSCDAKPISRRQRSRRFARGWRRATCRDGSSIGYGAASSADESLAPAKQEGRPFRIAPHCLAENRLSG